MQIPFEPILNQFEPPKFSDFQITEFWRLMNEELELQHNASEHQAGL